MAKKIMAWSKCKIEIGKTGDNDAMATELTSIGVISNQSSSLSAELGDSLTATATGGETVAEEPLEGTLQVVTTVIEPDSALLTLLGIADASGKVKTHIVDGNWSLKVTPKNKGAVGIQAPKTSISYQPAWDEQNGHTGILTFNILKTTDVAAGTDGADNNYWYERFTTTSAL